MALRSYFLTPTSEHKLTNPDDDHLAIRGLKVSRTPGPNGILNRALKLLPPNAVSHLSQIFVAVLLTHHFPTALSTDLYPYTGEGSGTALILSAH